MRSLFTKMVISTLKKSQFSVGGFSQVRNTTYGSFEGDVKSSVNFLNRDPDTGLLIDAFSVNGFRLNNQVSIVGPMIIFPRTVLSWKLDHASEINEESLRLFTILDPKVDLLVIGLGDADECRKVDFKVLLSVKKAGVNIELLSTEEACATFNFLCAEGRNVAGAFIPPMNIHFSEDDVMKSQSRRKDPFKVESVMGAL